MAEDVTTTEIPPATEPLYGKGPAMAMFDPPPEHLAELTAAARLRAFEDEHFGAEVVRINDRIERGSGSPFADAPAEVREQHARIEKLIATEQKLSDAHSALMVADAEHEAALQAVENADAPGE